MLPVADSVFSECILPLFIIVITGSEILRGSAEFRGFSRIFGHPWDQCKSEEKLEKSVVGGGGISGTTWPTEVVHISKSAELDQELCASLFRTVGLWHIASIQEKHDQFQAVLRQQLCDVPIFSLYFDCVFHCLWKVTVPLPGSYSSLAPLFRQGTREAVLTNRQDTG